MILCRGGIVAKTEIQHTKRILPNPPPPPVSSTNTLTCPLVLSAIALTRLYSLFTAFIDRVTHGLAKNHKKTPIGTGTRTYAVSQVEQSASPENARY